jgi:hypothetical protein
MNYRFLKVTRARGEEIRTLSWLGQRPTREELFFGAIIDSETYSDGVSLILCVHMRSVCEDNVHVVN